MGTLSTSNGRRLNHYRIIKPVSVNYTQVETYPCKLKGAPKSINDNLIMGTAHHVSALGDVQVDDMQAFSWVQEGLSSGAVEMVNLKLHGEEEHINEDGELEWHGASEAAIRHQYQEWARLMTRE